MLPSQLSRRALVAGAAVTAVASAPTAVARKRKRQPPPPPLAFYSVTMTAVNAFASGSDRAFEWDLSGAVYNRHPIRSSTGTGPPVSQ